MKKNSTLVLQHILWRGLYFFSILLINIGIARYFAAEKSGQIFFIINNLALVLLIVSISLESGTVYYISIGKLNAIQMARFCILWTLVAGILAGLGWWLGLRLTGSIFLRIDDMLVATILFIAGVLLTTFFTALFYSQQHFTLPNKILLAVNLLLIILLAAGNKSVWIRDHFLLLYFFSYFLQGVLLMITFFFRYLQIGIPGIPPSPILQIVIRYSAFALIANLIYFLVSRMDYWFVERYCSGTDLGNYIQASKLGQMFLIIPSILGSTLFPLIARGDKKYMHGRIAPAIRVLLWLNIGICLFIVLTGYWAFPLLFGPSFKSMYFIFLLLIPGILCLTANYPLTASNSGNDLVRRNITGSLIALIVIAVGDIFILPYMGVGSAAIISSLGYFSYYCYILLHYRKENISRLSDFFAIRKTDFSWLISGVKQFHLNKTAPDEIEIR